MADFGPNLKDLDHILGNQHFQVAETEVKQGIRSVDQAVVISFSDISLNLCNNFDGGQSLPIGVVLR